MKVINQLGVAEVREDADAAGWLIVESHEELIDRTVYFIERLA